MRVTYPVWCRATQLAGGRRVVGLNHVGRRMEEPAQDFPQERCGDGAWRIEVAEQRHVRAPSDGARRAYREGTLNQVLVHRKARERRQHDLAAFRALAGEMQPALAMRAGLNAAECDADQIGHTQTRRVTEVEQNVQALRSRRRPAMRPLDAIGVRAEQLPFAGREGARDVQVVSPLRPP